MPVYKIATKRLARKQREDELGITAIKAAMGIDGASDSDDSESDDSDEESGSEDEDGDEEEDDDEDMLSEEEGGWLRFQLKDNVVTTKLTTQTLGRTRTRRVASLLDPTTRWSLTMVPTTRMVSLLQRPTLCSRLTARL